MNTFDLRKVAKVLGQRSREGSLPRSPRLHLHRDGRGDRALIVESGRLVDVSPEVALWLEAAIGASSGGAASPSGRAPAAGLASSDSDLVAGLQQLGLLDRVLVDEAPLESPPLHALSLAVASGCNLACTYCYAQQGTFGGAPSPMTEETAKRSIDLLFADRKAGDRVNLSFLGGEPLTRRRVVRQATRYAEQLSQQTGVVATYSITTNGTLVQPDDGDFFEEHGFAVTISLDGRAEVHNRLRPSRSGRDTYDTILANVRPLLQQQRKMQVSARVTVTPANLDLVDTLERFISAGFYSVGFSPLLRSPNGAGELGKGDLDEMLDAMIACGLTFEMAALQGRRYPFSNMLTGLKELQNGTTRPYPCGAGAGYLAVSSRETLSACHRFVGDAAGELGSLAQGVDSERQNRWLADRHVLQQQPCSGCWARFLCGGGCHHEVLERGRESCGYIRGWLHYLIGAHGRLGRRVPELLRQS